MIYRERSIKLKFTCDYRQWAIYYTENLHPLAASQTYSSYLPLVAIIGNNSNKSMSEQSQKKSLYLQITPPSQSAALIKAKHRIRKFRIKRKSPPAASNPVLLRKIPKGRDQKLNKTYQEQYREKRRKQIKKNLRTK